MVRINVLDTETECRSDVRIVHPAQRIVNRAIEICAGEGRAATAHGAFPAVGVGLHISCIQVQSKPLRKFLAHFERGIEAVVIRIDLDALVVHITESKIHLGIF